MSDGPNTLLSEKVIRKQLNKFDKSFRTYREKLVEYYGDDFAGKVMAETRAEYEMNLPRTPAFPGRLNIFNMVTGINAKIVSFHKAMRANGKTVEETGAILIELAENEHDAITMPIRWVVRKIMFSPLFLILTRYSAKNVHDHP